MCHVEESYDETEVMQQDLPFIYPEAFDDEAVEEAERRVDWKRCLAVSRGFVRAITTPPVTTAAENSVVMAL